MTDLPKESYRTRHALTLTKTLIIFAVFGLLAELVNIIVDGMVILNAKSGIFPGLYRDLETAGSVCLVVTAVAWIIYSFSFLIWVYARCETAVTFAINKPMPFGPGLSVLWFLIPVANLFMPYYVITGIWDASLPSAGNDEPYASQRIVKKWWCFYLFSLVGGLLLHFTGRLSFLDAYEIHFEFLSGVILLVIHTFLALYSIRLVKSIDAMQSSKKVEVENKIKQKEPLPYRSTNKLTKVLIYLGLARIGLGGACLIFIWGVFLQGYEVALKGGALAENLPLVVVYYILCVISGIVFLYWVNRSCKNAHRLSLYKPMKYSSGWAVGYFFIPLVNLFMPMKVLVAIWNNSNPETDKEGSDIVPELIGCWWFLFVVEAIIERLILRGIARYMVIDGGKYFGPFCFFACSLFLCDMIMTCCCIAVVKRINGLQEKKMSGIQSGDLNSDEQPEPESD